MIEINSSFVTAIIYVTYLFLPGYFLLNIVRVQRNRFILSYAFSFCLLILTQIPFRLAGGTLFAWMSVINVLVIGLFIIFLFSKRKRPLRQASIAKRKYFWINTTFFSVISLFSIYHLIVGPYTEIPSDFWKHLARVQYEFNSIQHGTFLRDSFLNILFLNQPSYSYFLHAVVAWLLGETPLRLTTTVTLITSSIFLGTIYWFSLRLIALIKISIPEKTAAAVFVVILTFFWFGTATFSYIRYYEYFPTILNFPLFYASVWLFLDYLERPHSNYRTLLPIPLFLVTMLLVHKQEALFTLIMLLGISIWRSIRSYSTVGAIPSHLHKKPRLFALSGVVVISFLFIYALIKGEMSQWGHTPHVISTKEFFPFFGDLPIANPSFRFWDTLALFGVFTYIWYLVKNKPIRRIDFITVGMLSPLFTHFNPLYTALFLHFDSSPGLWRTSYLMPLPIVASFLLSVDISRLRKNNSRQLLIFIIAVITVIGLSLSPFQLSRYENRTSRFYSLQPIHSESGAKLWGDLIQAIEDIQRQRSIRMIFTDEVTQFVLFAATKGEIRWWAGGGTGRVEHLHEYFPKYKSNYQRDLLTSDITDHLLIINRRNGAVTGNARLAQHWPENILDISRLYPDDIDTFIQNHPENFELLWHADQISVYLMKSFSGVLSRE